MKPTHADCYYHGPEPTANATLTLQRGVAVPIRIDGSGLLPRSVRCIKGDSLPPILSCGSYRIPWVAVRLGGWDRLRRCSKLARFLQLSDVTDRSRHRKAQRCWSLAHPHGWRARSVAWLERMEGLPEIRFGIVPVGLSLRRRYCDNGGRQWRTTSQGRGLGDRSRRIDTLRDKNEAALGGRLGRREAADGGDRKRSS